MSRAWQVVLQNSSFVTHSPKRIISLRRKLLVFCRDERLRNHTRRVTAETTLVTVTVMRVQLSSGGGQLVPLVHSIHRTSVDTPRQE